MTTIVKLVLMAFFFACIVRGGHCECYPIKNLTIYQSPTHKLVADKPQWRVTITNDCECPQTDVKLNCDGFQTVEPIDPKIFSKSGSICTLNDGVPVFDEGPITFTYAWDTQYPLKISSANIACS